MSVRLDTLLQYLDATLEPARFRDYCPNGLQVEGRPEVARLATGVTASQALVDAAIAWGADALLVHHGYFWKGEPAPVIGMKRRRLGALLGADVSLLAYHLPLDAHPELGNNACLGRLLGIADWGPLDPLDPQGVGNVGSLPAATLVADFCRQLAQLTGREPLLIGDGAVSVRRVAWCTGAAQHAIDAAVAAGADLFLTGEVSEQTVHSAREQGIQFVAAGHHATERYGVQALGERLRQQFDLEHRYLDIANPV